MKSLSNISRWILKKKKGNNSNKSNHYGLAIYGGLYKLKWEYKANSPSQRGGASSWKDFTEEVKSEMIFEEFIHLFIHSFVHSTFTEYFIIQSTFISTYYAPSVRDTAIIKIESLLSGASFQWKDKNKQLKDCPGGPVVKNPPANVRDTGSISSLGRFHIPQGN